MQAAPARYVSVSELYSADEVELLLEEIRELEPTNCRGEELQDFEIAGSGAGGAGPGAAHGGRSPAGTEHSWDSHAHYSRAPPPPPRPLAPLYCHLRHLATLHGALTLLIVLSSGATCGCVWAVAGARPWAMPLASRVQLLLLGALTSFLLHTTLLLLHISQLILLLPINWNKLALWASLWSGGSLVAGGAGTLHALLAAPEYRWTPHHLAQLLYSASGIGMVCGCAALSLAGWLAHSCRLLRRPSPPSAAAAASSGARSSSLSLRAASYRAVPLQPPSAAAAAAATNPRPSTSRDNNL